jgi:2-phosphoglycerate kinase
MCWAFSSVNHVISQPDWKVLLIGGSSGVSKTLAAMEVARRYSVACSLVDDFRLVLQRMTTPAQEPVLHFFTGTEDVWKRSPEELCERLIEVGKLMSSCLEIVIAHHVATGLPLVLEGDGIVPSLAAQHSFSGLDVGPGQVHSVFLHEHDEEVIAANMRGRGRGFQHNTKAEQQTQARMSYLYGEWLRQQALTLNQPVVESRPWDTLVERMIEAIP